MSDWRWRAIPVCAALVFGAAATAPAQERARPPARLERGLSQETTARLREIIQRAEREGVPPELLQRKVNEGLSKGVRGPRLEQAIEAYARRLVAARRLAGDDVMSDVLVAAAEAAERGVPPDRIRAFLRANPNPHRSVVGLRVFGDLLDAGVPAGEAARGVNASLDRGLRGERLLALSAAVRRRIARGEEPSSALRAEIDGRR